MSPFEIFASAAFWVLLSFCTIIVWLLVQGYRTRWAHSRVDGLEKEVNEMRLHQEAMQRELDSIKDQNPYKWLKRATS